MKKRTNTHRYRTGVRGTPAFLHWLLDVNTVTYFPHDIVQLELIKMNLVILDLDSPVWPLTMGFLSRLNRFRELKSAEANASLASLR